MKKIVEFLKQRRNIKYSLGIIIFGLIFAFTFQVNKAQIPQILEEPIKIKIDLKTEEGKEHLVSGWKEEKGLIWIVGRTIIQKIPKTLPEKKPLLKPERIKEYYRLGKKYYKESQYSKARKEFQKVSALNPEYKKVKKYLEKIQSKIGTERKVERKPPKEKKATFKREALLRISLPEEKPYRMVIKAFSSSPPDTRDQRVEVHFNNVALDRLKFRKTPKWQKFSVNIPLYLLQETNTIKFIYREKISLSPIAFDSPKFKNYIFRIKGLYLLIDSYRGRTNYLTSHTIGYSFGFAILLWLFWLFYSCFPSFIIKIKFSRAIRIDFLSYLPSIIFLSALALFSCFSPYFFVYSLEIFFILAVVPTTVLKLFPYKDLSPRFIIELLQPVFRFILRISLLQPVFRFILQPVFRYILRDIERTYQDIRKISSALHFVFSFLKAQPKTFRKFLIHYHKTDLSSAFILDFMLLLILCAFLLMIKASVAVWIAEQVAILAYFLLLIGIIMKTIRFLKESKKE